MKTTSLSNNKITPGNFRSLRRLCGLAIAAIGLSAPIASADTTIPVQDPSFELAGTWGPSGPWASISTAWNTTFFPYSRTNDTNRFSSVPDGTWYANFTDPGNTATQDLLTAVNSGETLAVTFHVGRENGQVGGIITATFLVNDGVNTPTPYTQDFDATGLAQNTWQSYTLTKTIGNSGNLSLKFSRVSGRPWLDNISAVSVTTTPVNPNAPLSTNATLTVDEDVETSLAAGNFGYSDPNSDPLAAVKITMPPGLGTLKYDGNPVSVPLEVAVADIGKLKYQAATNANGSSYTTIGIAVQDSTGLWSFDATMTVNVTAVNDAPTSTGGSILMSLVAGPSKAFAAGDFQFSDVDAGDTLQAIKVSSLPANGALTYGSATVLIGDLPLDVPVATIGTLTYTPNTGTVADSFEFKVNDGALDSVTAATMAITVTPDIPVLNGGFEDPTPHNPNNGTNADWTAGGWAFLPAPWTSSYGGNYSRISYAAMIGTAQPGPWICNFNGSGIWIKQDLGSSVNAGDTLSVTFQLMSDTLPGEVTAEFQVGTGPTVYSQTFTSPQNNGTWVTYTLTKTVGAGVSGNLVLKFTNTGVANVNDRSWLDNISNVSVTTGGGGNPYTTWAGSHAFDSLNSEGVAYGMAWILGATSSSSPSIGLMPQVTGTSGSGLTVHFTRVLDPGTAKLYLEYSDSLDVGSWGTPVEVPTATGTVSGVGFTVTTVGGLYDITAEIPLGTSGKRFARLVTTE